MSHARRFFVPISRVVKNGHAFQPSFRQLWILAVLLLTLSVASAQVSQRSDEGTRVLALDNSWNRALETKDIKALDLLLADTLKSVDIDGSMQSKAEFLASIQAPGYHPPAHSVTEQSSVDVYGDSAVVVGIFRTTGVDRGRKYVKRERFVDTWTRTSGTWKCVATIAVLIPNKQSAD
jgi:ketosteroid isomerase-like protein